MNPKDVKRYPTLLAYLEARRRLCPACKYCGLVNAAWGTAEWTQDHPSCRRGYDKRVEALKHLNGKGV